MTGCVAGTGDGRRMAAATAAGMAAARCGDGCCVLVIHEQWAAAAVGGGGRRCRGDGRMAAGAAMGWQQWRRWRWLRSGGGGTWRMRWRVVFRVPYWSCDGPIEYVFNKIQTDLQGPFGDIDTVGDLENRIDVIIGGIQSYREYFLSVGFKDN